LIDPDGHFAFRDRTTPLAVIAQHVRRSLAEVHDYDDRFVDERVPMEFLSPVEERSKAALRATVLPRNDFSSDRRLSISGSVTPAFDEAERWRAM
jgi:hypothetical protein